MSDPNETQSIEKVIILPVLMTHDLYLSCQINSRNPEKAFSLNHSLLKYMSFVVLRPLKFELYFNAYDWDINHYITSITWF